MSEVLERQIGPPLLIHLSPVLEMTDEQFYQFCQLNRDLRIERTATGDLIIMPPTGGETGNRNFILNTLLGAWALADGTGKGFDSSTGFTLPNGAKRSPDAAWVTLERWRQLTDAQRKELPPLCPDFVVELRSQTDSLVPLQEKMQEYIENGARLGWLIDADNRRVYIYRPQQEIEVLENPSTVSGEPVLHGFTLNVQQLWSEQ
jgi:Uma2 family endonuclease